MVARNPYVVDFHTLWVVPAWIKRHCIIPDGFRKGRGFRMYDWQLWCTVNHYRVRENTRQVEGFFDDPDVIPIRAGAFHNRRSQVIAPQKTGKGPWAAAIVTAEAVGPVLFLDWAGADDVYDCAEHGCGCGWVYRYKPGEPMGHAWPTPLIQLLATSEDQVDNVYRPLQSMARGKRLRDRMKVREGFIRVLGGDGDPDLNRIDVVTSSAQSRLGNPITFCSRTRRSCTPDEQAREGRQDDAARCRPDGWPVDRDDELLRPFAEVDGATDPRGAREGHLQVLRAAAGRAEVHGEGGATSDTCLQLRWLAARRPRRHRGQIGRARREGPWPGGAVLRQPDRGRPRHVDGRRAEVEAARGRETAGGSAADTDRAGVRRLRCGRLDGDSGADPRRLPVHADVRG